MKNIAESIDSIIKERPIYWGSYLTISSLNTLIIALGYANTINYVAVAFFSFIVTGVIIDRKQNE